MGFGPPTGAFVLPALEQLEARLLLTTVTSVTIKEMDGVSTANYPVMLSMPFKDGDVPGNYVTAKVNGVAVPTQTDVKNRYADGSVKFALLSFQIPQLNANQTVAIDIDNTGVNHNAGYLTKAQLLATDFGAQMTIAAAGAPTTTIDARTLLGGLSNPEYWLQGDVASELVIKNLNVNVPNSAGQAQLNVQYYVTQFAGWNGYSVEMDVENDWSNTIQNYTYDFNLTLGYSSPQSVMSQSGFTQNMMSRWHQTFWVGSQPSNIQVGYDIDYLVAGGFVPNYDQNTTVSQATLANNYSQWLASNHGLEGSGLYTVYFPTTGGRAEIGPLPTWTVQYLLSMDNRQRNIMLGQADISGYMPYHLLEADPTRSSYQHILDANNRPTLWLPNFSGGPHGETAPADRVTAIGPTNTVWTIDGAHQGSFDYVPYLVTGDYFYMQEMVFLAGYDTNMYAPGFGRPVGTIMDQERGNAWVMRNVADAAAMAPDTMTVERTNLLDKVTRTLANWNTIAAAYPGAWHQITGHPGSGGGDFDNNITMDTAPWQEDFLLMELAHVKAMGYDSQYLLGWIGDTLINRIENPDFNPYRSSSYYQPVGTAAGPFTTWKQLNSGWADDLGPTTMSISAYNYGTLAALSYVLDKPGGLWAWEWERSFISTANGAGDGYNFSIAPLASLGATPDTTAPSTVTNLAAAVSSDTSVTLNWTAVGDDGTTGQAQLYDIRYSTSPITAANWASAQQVTGEPTAASHVTASGLRWEHGQQAWGYAAPAGSAETAVISGLLANTQYYFAVEAIDNARNYSAVSNSPSATTPTDIVPPAGVTTLAATGATDTSISLQWTAVGDDGLAGGAAYAYDLRYSTSPITDANWGSATPATGLPLPAAPGGTETFTVGGLTRNTVYYFAVKVQDNALAYGPLSNVASLRVLDDITPPAAITTLATTGNGDFSVSLQWTAPGDDGTVGTATAYDLRYSTAPITAGNWASATVVAGLPTPLVAGTVQTVTVSTGLATNTAYYFAIETVDNWGNRSGLSNVLAAATAHDVTPPAAVSDLAAKSVTKNSITVQWTAPGDDGTTGTAASYDLRYSTSPITTGNWASATQVAGEPAPAAAGTVQSFTVAGLASNKTYYFAIMTTDNVGNVSGLSNVPAIATITDTIPPAAISTLQITAAMQSAMTLSWTAPGDDGTTGTAASYDLRYSTALITPANWSSATPVVGEPAPAVAGTVQSMAASGLTPSTTYYFAIEAADAAGNVSSLSNVAGGATAAMPAVSFAAAGNSNSEGQPSPAIAVTLSAASLMPVTVNVAVTGGTAVSGSNYLLTAGQITFNPGETTKNVPITIIHDGVHTANLTIVIALSSPTNGVLGAITSFTYTMLDIDQPGVNVDFEDPASASQFVAWANAPSFSRVAGHGGYVLSVFHSNWFGSVKYAPGGAAYQVTSKATIKADVHMVDNAALNADSSTTTFILRDWTDAQSQYGNYAYSIVMTRTGLLNVRIGATKDNATLSWYADATHSASATTTLTTFNPAGPADLGWWNFSATMSVVNGSQVHIVVTATDPSLNVFTASWTDTGSKAVTTGSGATGLVNYGIYSVASQFDNYVLQVNHAPVVDAGADAAAWTGQPLTLSGTITDDGLPLVPGTVTPTWSKASGPGGVTFGNAHSTGTTATFDTAGTYVLQLLGDDGDMTASDMLSVTVSAPPAAPVLEAGSDSGVSQTDRITNVKTPIFDVAVGTPFYRFYVDGVQVSGNVAAGTSYQVASQSDGPHSYTATAVDAFGNESAASPATTVTIDTAAPAVTGVYVNSTLWKSRFMSYLGSHGLGDSVLGYAMPAGSDELTTLPWTNLNQISIVFSENVVIHQSDLSLIGINVPTYATTGAGTTFSYDPVHGIATWTLVSAIPADKLLVYLPDTVTDLAGNKLDGEWMTGSTPKSNFPSGNGVAGGGFQFRINVLPGDANRDGKIVNTSDTILVRNAGGLTTSLSGYSIFLDVDGSGTILTSDTILVRDAGGTVPPPGNPIAPAGGSSMSDPTSGIVAASAVATGGSGDLAAAMTTGTTTPAGDPTTAGSGPLVTTDILSGSPSQPTSSAQPQSSSSLPTGTASGSFGGTGLTDLLSSLSPILTINLGTL